jgi:hypothetical protein
MNFPVIPSADNIRARVTAASRRNLGWGRRPLAPRQRSANVILSADNIRAQVTAAPRRNLGWGRRPSVIDGSLSPRHNARNKENNA